MPTCLVQTASTLATVSSPDPYQERNTYYSCTQYNHEEVQHCQGSLVFGGEPQALVLIQPETGWDSIYTCQSFRATTFAKDSGVLTAEHASEKGTYQTQE
jgi:hypothetical protein